MLSVERACAVSKVQRAADRATRGCYIDILAAAEGFIFLMNLSVFRNLFAFDGAL